MARIWKKAVVAYFRQCSRFRL